MLKTLLHLKCSHCVRIVFHLSREEKKGRGYVGVGRGGEERKREVFGILNLLSSFATLFLFLKLVKRRLILPTA